MNFLFDNMMSPVLAKMLAAFAEGEHVVVHIRHDCRFSHDSPDDFWIPILARETARWAVVSGDIRMFSNPTIIAELQRSKLIFFCMDENWCSGNTGNSQAWKLLKLWPDIVARARGDGPAFYEINTGNRPSIIELNASRRARRRRLKI